MKYVINRSICTNVLVCTKTYTESEWSTTETGLNMNYITYHRADFRKYVSKYSDHSYHMNYFAIHQCMMKFFDGELYRDIIAVQDITNWE